MAEQEADAAPLEETRADVDERRIAKGVAIALPALTFGTALVVAVVIGPAVAILVVAAGVLLGVIALFWASIRVLSGDAPLPAELEALDAAPHETDPLAARKQMLVRAIKDLENEKALGKLEEEDYEQLTQTYRNDLKDVMKRIDASLEPYRNKAEVAARDYLTKAGILSVVDDYRGKTPPIETKLAVRDLISEPTSSSPTVVADVHEPRLSCPKCQTSNEIDASFCKKCGTGLQTREVEDEA